MQEIPCRLEKSTRIGARRAIRGSRVPHRRRAGTCAHPRVRQHRPSRRRCRRCLPRAGRRSSRRSACERAGGAEREMLVASAAARAWRQRNGGLAGPDAQRTVRQLRRCASEFVAERLQPRRAKRCRVTVDVQAACVAHALRRRAPIAGKRRCEKARRGTSFGKLPRPGAGRRRCSAGNARRASPRHESLDACSNPEPMTRGSSPGTSEIIRASVRR